MDRIVFLLVFLAISFSSFSQIAGSLDLSFANNGKFVTSIGSSVDVATGVAIQADGKIVVSGYTNNAITGKDFVCLRLNSNGTLDNTFATNGIFTLDLKLGSEDIANSIILQNDSKIILAGNSDNGTDKDAALIRLNTNGTLDNTFGNNGKVFTDFDNHEQDQVNVVKLHPITGKIVVGGYALINTNISEPVVARYNTNGTLDTTFNHTGIRTLWVTNLDYQYFFSLEDLVVHPNGKISFAGWRDVPANNYYSNMWFGRINIDGTMDEAFSTDGVNTYNGVYNANERAYSIALRADNSLVIFGGINGEYFFYRFGAITVNTAGEPSSAYINTFGGDSFGPSSNAYASAIDANGKYVLAGYVTSSKRLFAIARTTTGVSHDPTFDEDGRTTTSFTNDNCEALDVAIQADNKIVVVGFTGNDIAIARYLGNDDPKLDTFNLISPPNLTTNADTATLNFDWSDNRNAANYRLNIAQNTNFTLSPITVDINTSTATYLHFTPNTTYYWRVKAGDGVNFGNWTPFWQFKTKGSPTGIFNNKKSDLQIYPNPVSNHVNILLPSTSDGSYSLFDLTGKEVLHNEFLNKNLLDIDLQDFTLGTYIIRIKMDNTIMSAQLVKL
jgi:uncharacterized delta-60 repeat protein